MTQYIDRYFSKADLDRVEAAVTEAESGTEGEIALVITRRSSSLWQDGWLAAAAVGVAATVVWLLITRDSGWGTSYDTFFATVVGGLAFAVTLVLWRLPWARSGASRSVWKKALARFESLRPTRAKTGVLLYISLEERQVAVVADRAIAEKVSAQYWDGPRDTIVDGFKAGRQTEGILQAVRDIGAQLAEHFPRPHDDTNELPNRPSVE